VLDFSLSLYLGLILIFSGYVLSSAKILRNRSSGGVSLVGQVVCLVSWSSIVWNSENNEIFIMGVFGFFMSMTFLYCIYLYPDNKREGGASIFISLMFAAVMVNGVPQAVKSFRFNGSTRNVSVLAYFIWLSFSLNTLYLAVDEFVFCAALLTAILYFYIVVRCFDWRGIYVGLRCLR